MVEKTGLKILIVDDTPENLLVIAKTLETEGYDMRFAEDGIAAIAIAKKTNFDLVLLDVMMPNMDGFEVCRRLKADPNTVGIPVIFITAKADTDSIVKGFDIGGVDYITKPFHVGELRARVNTHLTLRQRDQELQQLNATKDKFISIIAHELKIPMGGIKGFIGLLHEQFEIFSIADIRENVTLIKDAVDNLFSLLENLLNWSMLQVGTLKYNPNNFELRPLLIDVIQYYGNEATMKGITVDVQCQDDIWVHGDTEMLEAVVRNIVANAVKFGRENGAVRIFATPREQEILVIIEDNGIGIPKDKQQKLFQVDAEVKRLGTRGEIGTGMGLILAKEYIALHSGRIWLESEPEQGTRVFFTLQKTTADK